MKTARILTIYACMALGFAACKGKNVSSKADSNQVNLVKDSSGMMSDSTVGKVPDSSKKSTTATAATGPKAHVDSVAKK